MSIQTERSATRIDYLTPKERLIKALRGEQVDVYPVAPAYPSLFLADFERAFYAEQYRLRLRGRLCYPVQFEEDIQLRKLAFYQSYGIFKARPDWMEAHQGASRAWAKRTEMVLQDGLVYYQDIDTGVRAAVKDIYMPSGDSRLASQNASLQDLWDTSGQIESKEQIDELIPVVKAEELLERGDFEYPRQVVADYGDEYFLSTVLDTPFSNAYDTLGFQGLMLFQHDRPDLLHYILERNLLQTEEEMKGWAASGIHGVYVEEVFTGADIISQRSYDEFVFPYNKVYFEFMSKLGLLPIHYVCGNIIPRLERISQLEIAALAAEESKKNFRIDLAEIVQIVDGRVAVFGNIDAIQFGLHASLDEVAGEVRRQVQTGAQAKGFVVSTGSPFPLDTNPRVIDTLVKTAHSFAPDQINQKEG
jgi:uroporphyrinogen-III decarboxylase